MLGIKKLIVKILGQLTDTGWQKLSTSTGVVYYRVMNRNVYIVGSGLNVQHNTTFLTLPASIRPSIRITTAASFPLDRCIYVNLFENGNMAAIIHNGGAINNLFFTMSYPI